MNKSEKPPEKKIREKKDKRLVENSIYQVGPNLYDVRVRKRINGKQETRSQRSVQFLSEARKTRNNFILELELKEQEIQNGDLTWKVATEKYFEFRRKLVGDQSLAHKTVSNQESVVGKHTDTWNDMRLSAFKRDFIEVSLREKLIGYKKTSVKDILKHIRAVFEYYFNQEKTPIGHNPCKGIKPWGADNREEAIEIPKMTMEEIDKLLDHTERSESQWYPIFYVAYYTGMRSGELWGFKWSDIDPDFKTITVKRSYCFDSKKEKPPKNGKPRKVAITSELAIRLKEWKLKSDSSYVLEHPPMWRDGKIAKVLNIFQQELKISKTTFHSIRASHITHLLLIGQSVASVMNSVGHFQLATTMRYLREIEKEKSIDGMTEALVRKNNNAGVIPLKKGSSQR